MSFNHQALQHLVDNPAGKVARHVRKRTQEISQNMRDEAFNMQKEGARGIPRPKFEEIIQNQPAAKAASQEIGMPPQIDSRTGNRTKSFADYLAAKATRDQLTDNWIARAIRKHPDFKRVR